MAAENSASGSSEPSYNGKSLSEWLKVHANAPTQAEFQESESAVRHIGTNAIPFLVADLAYQPRDWMVKMSSKIQSWPKPLGPWLDPAESSPNRVERAQDGFSILGLDAAPAIPALIVLAGRMDLWPRPTAALAAIGSAAVTPLTETVADHGRSFDERHGAVNTLGNMGTNAASSATVLLGCLDDPRLAREAAVALGQVVVNPESLIPALTNGLHSGSSSRRMGSAVALGRFGHKAESAVPALQRCLVDEDSEVQWEVRKAISAIQGFR